MLLHAYWMCNQAIVFQLVNFASKLDWKQMLPVNINHAVLTFLTKRIWQNSYAAYKRYFLETGLKNGFSYRNPNLLPKNQYLIQTTLKKCTQSLESLRLFGHFPYLYLEVYWGRTIHYSEVKRCKERTAHYMKYEILVLWGGAGLDLVHWVNATTSCFFDEIMTVMHRYEGYE